MNKFKLIIIDLFFVVSSVIGVGFVTGKEIAHFFGSGNNVWVAVGVFLIVFVGLGWYFLHIKHKYQIDNLTKLNSLAFGKYYDIGNMVLIVLFIVTNSAMLAGCDNLASNYMGISFPIMSLGLSIITYFIALGGVKRIKKIANIITPILVGIILINAIINLGSNKAIEGNASLDIIYPIIFCCENFVTIISVLLSTNTKPRTLSILSGITISIVVLLSALAIGGLNSDMPMLTLSNNVGTLFFAIYLIAIIFALFTTLEISTYHCLQVCVKKNKDKYFILALILLVSQIIAYLGFTFIVKYLYTAIGIFSAIYLIALIVSLVVYEIKTRPRK